MATGLSVKVLGPLEVARRGRQVRLGGGKPRLALALLSLQPGRVVSPNQLIDALWGENPPATARKALQVHISSLRRSLGEDAVRTENGGYVLDAEVDAVEFESKLESGGQLVTSDPETAIETIAEALGLWRDTPFADLPDEDAVRAARTRLIELRLRAVEQRIEALLALGRHHEVLGDLETLTSEHPFREELRELQMLALYRSGRQADALRAYQATRNILADELGIDPSPDLQRLEQQILEQDQELDPAVSHRPHLVSTLPARRTDLVGRGADCEEVLHLLVESHLVTLTGVGGCGKTRLAIEVGHRAEGKFDDGRFFVDLTRVSDDDAVLPAIICGIQLARAASFSEMDQLVDFLRPRTCLLIVDNCEHVLDGVAEVLDTLLDRCPNLTILATSREALAIPSEHAWRVPSLAVDDAKSAAVELFVTRAIEADASFRLATGQEEDVIEICRRLDGIPLAIELAAARTKAMTVGEIRQKLDDRFRLLVGSRRRMTQRQQTLQGTVEWSYGLLTDAEQTMLRRLSVFQGGFDPSDVPAVTGFDEADTSDLIDSLTNKSLIDIRWSEGTIARRRLLETIRLFALDKLTVTEEAEQTRERHYDVFAASVHTSYAAMFTRTDLMARHARELDNTVAAIEWGIDTGRKKEAALTVARNAALLASRGSLTPYQYLLEGDHDLEPAEAALLLCGRTQLFWMKWSGSASRLAELARSIETDEVLDDIFFPQLAEMDMAPVEGAEGRLAALDAMLVLAEQSPSRNGNVGAVEFRRAGQLFSLGRLEEALIASRQSLTLMNFNNYPIAVATLALLVFLDRREEAVDVLDAIANAMADTDAAPLFVTESNAMDFFRGVCQVGAGDPRAAGAALARSALSEVTGRIPFQDGEYLCLFAAYQRELGNDVRADELLKNSQSMAGTIPWLVWPYVWKWAPKDFVESNRRARLHQLEQLLKHSKRTLSIMPKYLEEEIEFWLS